MIPAETLAAIEQGDLSPGCGNDTCSCRTNPPFVCDEWMGLDSRVDGTESDVVRRWCPRCGWAKHLAHRPLEGAS